MELTLRLLWFFSIARLSSDAWLSPFLEASFGWVTFPELPFTPLAPDTIFYKYIHWNICLSTGWNYIQLLKLPYLKCTLPRLWGSRCMSFETVSKFRSLSFHPSVWRRPMNIHVYMLCIYVMYISFIFGIDIKVCVIWKAD